MDLSIMSKTELLEKCKELGITRCLSKNKSQLVELIQSKQTKQTIENNTFLERSVKTNDLCEIRNERIAESVRVGDGLICQNGMKENEEGQVEVVGQETPMPVIKYTSSSISPQSYPTPFAPSTLSFIEVCAGGGGLSSGLIKAGFTPVLLNDNNSDCCKTLKHNHSHTNVVFGSMEKVDYSQYINRVDLLTGGVPCQSFSQAGLRKGLDDPRGDLMMKFIEILEMVKPRTFMIENVKGLLTHNDGKTIQKIIDEINRNNLYNVSYKCLDASKYDVPQKRERVFIVGVLKSMNRLFEFPAETTRRIVLKDVLYDVPVSNGAKYTEEKINLFKMIPQGGCWVNLPENLQREYLGNSYNSGGGKRGILYRLSMEKPSLTLLCTPSQKQTERCHPLEERPLTLREYARIQTFEDSYEFIGSISSQYKQIGNAVPVELARHMGISLMRVLQD
jgi:DNA (cytosine-5)-methyltransferase 1